jgi:hypothetical protein
MSPPPWWSDPWWRWFLTVAFASMVTGALFFVANWCLTSRNRRADQRQRMRDRRDDQRQRRIADVVGAYIRLASGHPVQDNGIHALIIAGAKSLQTNDEIQEVFDRIAEAVGHHPLGPDGARLNPVALKAFVQEIIVQGPNTPNYQQVLAKYSTR